MNKYIHVIILLNKLLSVLISILNIFIRLFLINHIIGAMLFCYSSGAIYLDQYGY